MLDSKDRKVEKKKKKKKKNLINVPATVSKLIDASRTKRMDWKTRNPRPCRQR